MRKIFIPALVAVGQIYHIGYIQVCELIFYTRFGINSNNISIFVPDWVYFSMNLPEHIKLRRKKNGLTQVDLAERAGVGLRFVRDLEQGKQTLRMDKVNDVLALFGESLGPVKNEQV